MKILGIETSSHLFSLCVNEDDKIVYEVMRNRFLSQNRDAHFFAEAKKLIESYGLKNIGAIAIDIGPGMFTSLRVGLSLAKGLALAQNIPIVTVNSLDVIGISMRFAHYPILAVINAYHGELYAALYKQGERVSDYLLTTPKEVRKIIKCKTMVIGSGVDILKELCDRDSHLYCTCDTFLLPTASKVISIALPRIHNGQFDAVETLEPYYIKKTDAERNYNQTYAS